jgi:hypothetical protein
MKVAGETVGFELGVQAAIILRETMNQQYGLGTGSRVVFKSQAQREGGREGLLCVAVQAARVIPTQGFLPDRFDLDACPSAGVLLPFGPAGSGGQCREKEERKDDPNEKAVKSVTFSPRGLTVK